MNTALVNAVARTIAYPTKVGTDNIFMEPAVVLLSPPVVSLTCTSISLRSFTFFDQHQFPKYLMK